MNDKEQNYFVVKDNELVQKGRYSLSLQQNKILLYLISRIKPYDDGTEVYKFVIKDFCRVFAIKDAGDNYDLIKNALKSLADKSIWVEEPDGNEILLRWINHIRLNKSERCFEIKFHEDMLPYLFQLQEQYTQYSLCNIIGFKSKYSLRLYELLMSYKKTRRPVKTSLDELKKRLDITCYEKWADFKRYVLDEACNEINSCTDLDVDYEPYKGDKGKKIQGVIFKLSTPSGIDAALRYKKRHDLLLPK